MTRAFGFVRRCDAGWTQDGAPEAVFPSHDEAFQAGLTLAESCDWPLAVVELFQDNAGQWWPGH